MSKEVESNSNTKTLSETRKSESKDFSWIKFISATASVITVVLLLLGYGVSLAVESVFGVPHSALLDSPFDLLDLSMIAVSQIITQGSNFEFGLDVILKTYNQMMWIIICPLIGLLILFLIDLLFGKRIRAWQQAKKHLRLKNKSEKRDINIENTAGLSWIGKIGLCLLVISTPILSLFSAGVLLILLAMCLTFPMLGLISGKNYIKDWVVKPQECLPVLNAQDRIRMYTQALAEKEMKKEADKKTEEPEYGVSCVVLNRGDKSYSGRVVFTSSKALVLFSPHDGRVYRIPTSDSVIEVVDKLLPPVVSK
jgi:hypothetical protein